MYVLYNIHISCINLLYFLPLNDSTDRVTTKTSSGSIAINCLTHFTDQIIFRSSQLIPRRSIMNYESYLFTEHVLENICFQFYFPFSTDTVVTKTNTYKALHFHGRMKAILYYLVIWQRKSNCILFHQCYLRK